MSCDDARLPLPTNAAQFQVNSWVQVYVTHATPRRHIGVPLGRVIADEVGDVRLQPV